MSNWSDDLRQDHLVIEHASEALSKYAASMVFSNYFSDDIMRLYKEFNDVFVGELHCKKEEKIGDYLLTTDAIPTGLRNSFDQHEEVGRHIQDIIDLHSKDVDRFQIAEQIFAFIEKIHKHMKYEEKELMPSIAMSLEEKSSEERINDICRSIEQSIGKNTHIKLEYMANELHKMASDGESEIIDARKIPPTKSHELIRGRFEKLNGGNLFMINDQESKDIYHEFFAEIPDFNPWNYKTVLLNGSTWVTKFSKKNERDKRLEDLMHYKAKE